MSPGGEDHLRPEEVAAYLAHGLGGPALEGVEAHLAECAACRRELVEVTRLEGSASRGRRAALIGGLAAAAAVVLVVGEFGVGGGPDRGRVERSSDPAATLAAHEPRVAARLDDLTFAWASAAPGAMYRLTLTDAGGAVRWTAETSDTVAAPPDTLRLEPGATYHWYVDALLPAGSSRTTGVREFRLIP